MQVFCGLHTCKKESIDSWAPTNSQAPCLCRNNNRRFVPMLLENIRVYFTVYSQLLNPPLGTHLKRDFLITDFVFWKLLWKGV